MRVRARNSVHATPLPVALDGDNDEKPLRFFSKRRLSTLFRRASVTSPPGASSSSVPDAVVGRMSAPSSSLGATISSFLTSSSSSPLSSQATNNVTAIDQEMVFFGAKTYALATSNGVRPTNEDRFRVITSLERFGRGLLATEKKKQSGAGGVRSYDDALTTRLMEAYVNNANAPVLLDAKKKNYKSSKSGGDTEFYGIYDGHGGARCSSLLALLLPLYLLRQREFETDIASAAKRACLDINEEILRREAANQCEGGSTAITLLIRKSVAYFCNTGDCRAVVVSRKGVAALTTDHKATNELEKQRVEEAGGIVLYVHGVARVNGRLAVSRAFGDSELKEVVIPMPDVTTHELTADDEFIVLASDGLWDALPNETVLSCIRTHPWLDVHEMAKLLIERAVELGSMDNVTVLIVDVRKRPLVSARGTGWGLWSTSASWTAVGSPPASARKPSSSSKKRVPPSERVPVMADKRRKRKTDAPASSYEDGASSKVFHAVDISDPSVMPRRRSYTNSSSSSSASARGESWMTKVTAAMSHRIFSGKKLGASRSTQVMPLAGVATATTTGGSTNGQETKHHGSSLPLSSSSHGDMTIITSISGPGHKTQTLRQVSSENSLVWTTTAGIGAPPTSTPVEQVDFCPNVVCDIIPNEEEAHVSVKKQQSALQSIQVRGSAQQQQQRNANSSVVVIEKIVPCRGHVDNGSDVELEDMPSRQRRHTTTTTNSRTAGSMVLALDRDTTRYTEDSSDNSKTPAVVQDTAPILKDFFSRNASTGQGLRVQQRENRRESLYKTSKQRQERLRKRVEDESQVSETQLRKLRAEQLQKLNQQRRLQLKQEAACAHKAFSSRLVSDQQSFVKERERWECEFESEIRTLSHAFRKASAKGQSKVTEEEDEGGANRPMTVAGLAVPQALAQIRRDASNYEKRLKTAAPRSSQREWGFAPESAGASGQQRPGSSGGRSCDIFSLEDSAKGDGEYDGEEDSFEVLYASESANADDKGDSRRSRDAQVTIDELLNERASLLQRITQLEKLVESQQITQQ